MLGSQIKYEYAFDARGEPRHIRELDSSESPYRCGNCNGEMIAKKGDIRQWHFARKADAICNPKADPDNALHQYAQDIVIEAFNRSREADLLAPYGIDRKNVDPMKHLDGGMLEGLIKWVARREEVLEPMPEQPLVSESSGEEEIYPSPSEGAWEEFKTQGQQWHKLNEFLRNSREEHESNQNESLIRLTNAH